MVENSILAGRRRNASEILQYTDIVIEQGAVKGVFVIPALFFAFYKPGFRQDLDMMGNRWLGEVYHVLNTRALSAPPLVRKIVQDLKAVDIAQCLGYFLYFSDVQCHDIVLINANISIINSFSKTRG